MSKPFVIHPTPSPAQTHAGDAAGRQRAPIETPPRTINTEQPPIPFGPATQTPSPVRGGKGG
jgi:hypothetical protein